jgi:hypothetical protein
VLSQAAIKWFLVANRKLGPAMNTRTTILHFIVVRLTVYRSNTNGGPLTRFPLRSTVNSTPSAILMKGTPLFIP